MFGLEPTPFDLRMVVFRIPVRVHPSFWIAGILLAWHPNTPPILIFDWVMCLFFSILVHELGHALMSEAFGWTSHVVLYWCGGLAMSQRYVNRTPLREMAVALAGPFAGFGLYGLTMAVDHLLDSMELWLNPTRFTIMGMLYRINLWWGLINLLPVLPLDGGRVCTSFLELCRQSNPLRTAIQVSVVISACAAFVFFAKFNERFAGMLFAMLCLQNLASLQDPHAR